MVRITISTAALVLLLMPAIASAGDTPTAMAVQGQWAIADKCNRNAIANYPDHASEALAKRDQNVRRCLVYNGQEARTPLSPPQAPKN
jgi:hypothetical protein